MVELLKHADIEETKLTWNVQVYSSAVTVKAEKPIETIGEVTIQATDKKYPSPSKRHTQRINQWKVEMNEAVVNIKVHSEAQTDNSQIVDTTQTDKRSSYDLDHNTLSGVLQNRERSIQSRNHIKGMSLTPSKYRNEDQSQKP